MAPVAFFSLPIGGQLAVGGLVSPGINQVL